MQLGDLVEVTLALEFFDLKPHAVDVFLDQGRALHRSLFSLPNFIQVGGFALQLFNFFFDEAEAFLGGFVLLAPHRLAFDLQLDQAPIKLVHGLGLGVNLDLDFGRGLIDQVDGLVGQEAVGDVALAQLGGCDDRRVSDLDTMVHFVLLLQPAQNGDRRLYRRFANQDLLKTAL